MLVIKTRLQQLVEVVEGALNVGLQAFQEAQLRRRRGGIREARQPAGEDGPQAEQQQLCPSAGRAGRARASHFCRARPGDRNSTPSNAHALDHTTLLQRVRLAPRGHHDIAARQAAGIRRQPRPNHLRPRRVGAAEKTEFTRGRGRRHAKGELGQIIRAASTLQAAGARGPAKKNPAAGGGRGKPPGRRAPIWRKRTSRRATSPARRHWHGRRRCGRPCRRRQRRRWRRSWPRPRRRISRPPPGLAERLEPGHHRLVAQHAPPGFAGVLDRGFGVGHGWSGNGSRAAEEGVEHPNAPRQVKRFFPRAALHRAGTRGRPWSWGRKPDSVPRLAPG